jgi:uncharacterized protein YbjQ (UPF0145 family)
MAECISCGKEIKVWEAISGQCDTCHSYKNRLEHEATQKSDEARLRSIVISTETMLEGVKVKQRLGIVTAECAYGMNVFKDLFASIRNIVGGRSEAVQNTMRDARDTVLSELKKEAYSRGANAVIAVDLDYTQIGDGGAAMVLLVASGTAVVIEEGRA